MKLVSKWVSGQACEWIYVLYHYLHGKKQWTIIICEITVTCYYYISFVIECTAKNLICMAFKYLKVRERSENFFRGNCARGREYSLGALHNDLGHTISWRKWKILKFCTANQYTGSCHLKISRPPPPAYKPLRPICLLTKTNLVISLIRYNIFPLAQSRFHIKFNALTSFYNTVPQIEISNDKFYR